MTRKLTAKQFESIPFDFVFGVDVTESQFEECENHRFEDDDSITFNSCQAGYCVIESECGLKLSFSWFAQGGNESYNAAHEFDIQLSEDMNFEPEGFVLVDEDGEPEEDNDHFFIEKLEHIDWEQSVHNEMPIAETEELDDTDGDTDMIKLTDKQKAEMNQEVVERDNAPDLKFTGVKIAMASSKPAYGNDGGRWTVLELYATKGGKYIAATTGVTCWQGEHDRYDAKVCNSEADVIEYLGHGWVAKEIYEIAGIENTKKID